MESHKRSIIKTLTWRITATLITTLVVYLLSGEVLLSLGVGFIDAVIKIFAYYSHERIWDRIRFGRKRVSEDSTI